MKKVERSSLPAQKFLLLILTAAIFLTFPTSPIAVAQALPNFPDLPNPPNLPDLPIFAPQLESTPTPTPTIDPSTTAPIPQTQSEPEASPSATVTTPPTQSISVPTPPTATPNIGPSPPERVGEVIKAIDPILRTVSAHIYGGRDLPEGVSLLTLIVSFFYLAAGLWLARPDLFRFLTTRKAKSL